MNVLIAYASRHGSTQEIAEAIATEIDVAGFSTDLRDVADVSSLEGVDAVVLGSAVYVGQWQESAVGFIETFREGLQRVPVWLFSSGPIGEDLFPKEDPPANAELVGKTGARDVRSFAGRLDRTRLGFGERLVSKVVRAPEGDFRQWQRIREWGREIARELAESGSVADGMTGHEQRDVDVPSEPPQSGEHAGLL